VIVFSEITHHTHRPHRQQHRERLPYCVVETGRKDLLEEDRTRFRSRQVERSLREEIGAADLRRFYPAARSRSRVTGSFRW
jgi:hypothetical protein